MHLYTDKKYKRGYTQNTRPISRCSKKLSQCYPTLGQIIPSNCRVKLQSINDKRPGCIKLASIVTAVLCHVGPRGPAGPSGVAGPPGPAGPPGGGVSYTRWGRTTCPTTQGTQLVYEGAVVGSRHIEAGSAEYLCLHNQPEFLHTTPGLQDQRANLYGTEYKSVPAFSNYDAPCSVCYTPSRSTKITIPGRITCPDSWTREYYGYLMTTRSHEIYKPRVPICVDENLESVAGSGGKTDMSLLMLIETTCTGIKCPPYSNGAEIACVVCTK